MKAPGNFFLWPESRIKRALRFAFKPTPVHTIEEKLQEMFPGGYPVLCSSGRAALFMALRDDNVGRNDLVGIFPYASFCVFDAVARVGSPVSGPGSLTTGLRIAYHQWGYVQESELKPNTIEDCVDTLCVQGASLFPGGGMFEVWSLPKILGTTSGGVLWCKSEEAARRIQIARDKGRPGLLQWLLRLLMSKFTSLYDRWQGAECSYRKISVFQTGEIFEAIKEWDSFVADRRTKIEAIWPMALSWLPYPTDRLPTVVPCQADVSGDALVAAGIMSGFRTMERIESFDNRQLIKVIPIPIHQDVPLDWVKGVFEKLNDSKDQ